MPPLIEEPRQRQHPQPCQGVQGRHPQAAKGRRLLSARGELLEVGAEAGIDLHDGGEGGEAVRLAADAHQELLGHGEDQALQDGGEEIQQQIEGREGEDVPRQHGAQSGHAEKGHRQKNYRQNGIHHRCQIKKAPADGQQAGKEPGHRVGNGQHGQAREGVGGKQARPVHRQGVEQAG